MDGALAGYALEWLSLLGRWLHVVTGIAWIGASFYFVWLDNHLLPPAETEAVRKGVGGELWAVHGGGFYHAQKYRLAPPQLPQTLHWFYWEAYATWLSGFFLLALLYYGQAGLYLIDPAVAPLSRPAAVAIGLAFLAGTWGVYDTLCRSPLGRSARALGAAIALLLCVEAWALCHLFSGRGAYVEFGAALGTLMVGNVLWVIIPGQRRMVAAARAGRAPDPRDGLRGKQRSVHNTYFTLPVLFCMISNHYAHTYGARDNALALIGLAFAGAAIRAWFVARHTAHTRGGRSSPLPALLGVLALLVLVFVLKPLAPTAARPDAVAFAQVQAIVMQRCAVCHAEHPSQAGFSAAPKGRLFDTPERILAQREAIVQQVATRAMPLGNLTQMSEDERAAVLAWSAQQALPAPQGASP
jgi:uncharacterized membrane protein